MEKSIVQMLKQPTQIDTVLLRAKLLGKRNDWRQAAELLEISVTASTENADRAYYLSHCYYNLNEFEKAVPFAERAVELDSSNKQWLHRLASLYARIGRHDRAVVEFGKLSELQPEQAKWHYYYGKSLLAVKKNAEALEELRLAATLEPDNRDYVNFLSDQFRKRKIYWEQALLLERANPATPAEHAAYGRALFKMNQFSAAAEQLATASRKSINDAQLAYEAGLAFERANEIVMARDYYRDAIARDTAYGSKTLGIGVFHEKYKYWDYASLAYAKSAEENSANAELHYRAGLANDRLFSWSNAEKHYRKAVTSQPTIGRWHYKLALSLERQQKWVKAAEVYEYAAAAFDNKYWWYRAGLAWEKADQYEDAFKALASSVPNFERTRLEMVGSLGTTGSSYLKSILEETPNIPVVKRGEWFIDRARLWLTLGDTPRAISNLELALTGANTHSTELVVMLSVAYTMVEDWISAVNTLRNFRIFKWQDGIDVENRTKNLNVRNIAEYAEYYEDLVIDENLIVWQSNGGESIGCHPLALFEEMKKAESFEQYKHIWVLNDENTSVPESVRDSSRVVFTKRHSDAYRRALASAKYLVNNSTFPGYYIRKDGQRYLNTWHGTPYKTLGKDMRGEMFKHAAFVRDILQSTHMISPNSHTTDVLLDSHDVRGLFTGKLAEIGSPRIDRTLNISNERREQILKMLSISDGKPIVLYAPTWRGSSNKAEVDSQKLVENISELSKVNGHLLFRAHRLEEQALRDIDVDASVVPASIDTNELLAIVDVLITDYSSIFYDYLPLNRPIVFFMYDQEEYIEERGLYFENSDLPGSVEQTASGVTDCVNRILSDEFVPDSVQIEAKEEFCYEEDGSASRRVLDFWMNDDFQHGIIETDDERRTLVFQQSMIPTGMSSSFLNLVNALSPDKYRVVLLVEPRLILSEPGRQETISRLPRHVQVIGRSGGRVMTPEELWVAEMLEGSNRVLSPELWDVYMHAFKREARRIFGTAQISASIQFDGYVPFWNGISAAVGQDDSTARIIYLHNDMFEEWDKRWPNLELTFAMYEYYDSLISVSETMRDVNKESLTDHFGVNGSKFDFCENMINVADILERGNRDIPSEYAGIFDESKTVFLTSGRLSIEKDQQKLIRAFAIHRESYPDSHLVLLGDGPLRAELQTLTTDLGLDSSVTFAGRVENPYPFVSKASCFVLPSNHEGQPMVLLEALVLGKKIFATNIPGSAHVLRDGLGLIVENSLDGVKSGLDAFREHGLTNRKFDYEQYSRDALESFEAHLSIR